MKYVLEISEANNVGYHTKRIVFDTKEEAQRAFSQQVETFIQNTVENNDLDAEDEREYRKEIRQSEPEFHLGSEEFVEDPDFEWYVSIAQAQEAKNVG